MTTLSQEPSDQGAAAGLVRQATRSLRLSRSLRRTDVTFFAIATVVGLDTIGAVAADGAQAFTWMVFLCLTFFLPYALLTAELGSAFPLEGGPYAWVELAFGRMVGSITAVFYWISNPVWLGGTLAVTSLAVIGEFLTPLHGAAQYVFGLAFVWVGIGAVTISVKYGKWLPNLGGLLRIGLLGFFTASVIVYATQHGLHGFGASAFRPSYVVFIAAAPVLAFNYAGVEVPLAAGEEIEDPSRSVPLAILRSGITVALLYAAPILAILLVLPRGQITNLGGFIDAMKTVFTVYGGHVDRTGAVTLTGAGKVLGDMAAIAFVLALLSGAVAWLMGGNRAQAIAARSGSAPPALGRFSERLGTPAAVNLISGGIASTFVVLALALTSGNVAQYFSAVLGLTISTTLIAYIAICPAVIKLRYSHPEVLRPYGLPLGNAGAWICGMLGTVWAALATVVLVWPGLGTPHPAASLPSGFAHERLQYELSQMLPLAIIVLVGVVFCRLGRRTGAAGDGTLATKAPARTLT